MESAEQYKKNGDKKPPFSYSTLICMAMKAKGNKVTLSSIYGWIKENFLYYRNADPSWKVKHKLTGSVWTVDKTRLGTRTVFNAFFFHPLEFH